MKWKLFGMAGLGLATSHGGKAQIHFHPHAVWASLARTDSPGLLAPCTCWISVKLSVWNNGFHTHRHTHTLLNAETFRLHTEVLHAQKPSHTHKAVFTHRSFTHKSSYTQIHTGDFTQRRLQNKIGKDAPMHISFYTQNLLQTKNLLCEDALRKDAFA